MSFSYGMGSNPTIDFPRLLIGDTVEQNHVFEDEEIQSAYVIQQSQFQSSMMFTGSAGRTLPSSPVSYLRVAALLLDALASNRARIISVQKLLDVTLAPNAAQSVARELREQAAEWRKVDDESGAFVIIEQCTTQFAYIDRFWRQLQRNVGI